MQNLNLKVESVSGINNELVIRTGAPLPVHEPVVINISGDINTVSSFLKNRLEGYDLQKVDKSKAIVTVDKEKMSILLQLDPQNKFGTTVQGNLEKSEELKTFGINQTRTFTRDELIKLIKFNKLSFDDSDKHSELLKAYMAFDAKVYSEMNAENDQRGNRKGGFSKQVTTNIPNEFILLIPIFKGKDAVRFRVEICLDVTDNSARFWFESVELHELINTSRDIIFNEELRSCEGFVIINK